MVSVSKMRPPQPQATSGSILLFSQVGIASVSKITAVKGIFFQKMIMHAQKNNQFLIQMEVIVVL